MSGNLTRQMYDACAQEQYSKQSTDQLEFNLDINKYVNQNKLCTPDTNAVSQNTLALVDIESALKGIDKMASKCDADMYPLCGSNGCLLNNDKRIAPTINPRACERGGIGQQAVITNNIPRPQSNGLRPLPKMACGIPKRSINNGNNTVYSNSNNRNNQAQSTEDSLANLWKKMFSQPNQTRY